VLGVREDDERLVSFFGPWPVVDLDENVDGNLAHVGRLEWKSSWSDPLRSQVTLASALDGKKFSPWSV
jgi:hypothetical protein